MMPHDAALYGLLIGSAIGVVLLIVMKKYL